jgi:FAD/FMN-containing dehydrogenase
LLDAPDALRAESDPWGTVEAPALALMRSVKRRFDPTATCNPGLFVGGI